jgi:hypothetical protein
MPVPPANRLRFFVYIIESPSAADLYHRRYEGEMLERSLRLNEVVCESHLAISRDAFEAALEIGLPEAMKKSPDLIPIVHVSAHGDGEGLVLSDNSSRLSDLGGYMA